MSVEFGTTFWNEDTLKHWRKEFDQSKAKKNTPKYFRLMDLDPHFHDKDGTFNSKAASQVIYIPTSVVRDFICNKSTNQVIKRKLKIFQLCHC